jgi:Mor family transcriptional regulator
MAVRKVPQNQVLEDIRSGMDETAIRKKYNLSAQGVKRLYEKLIEAKLLGPDLKPPSRRLNLLQFLADIRAGMSNPDIMEKYKLSEDMLRQVSKKLLDARMTRSVEEGPVTTIEERPDFLATREFVRHEVDFELPVYEAGRPELHGLVRDVSEEGVGVAGIEAKVGDLKTLVILGDEFGEFSSFEFEAYCRWCYADKADGTCLAGFAISKISKNDLQQLKMLVRLVRLF